MDLAVFQYEPVSLDVNKVCFGEERDIPNTRDKMWEIWSNRHSFRGLEFR